MPTSFTHRGQIDYQTLSEEIEDLIDFNDPGFLNSKSSNKPTY